MWGLSVKTPPANSPVELNWVKERLGIVAEDHTHDAELNRLIASATETVQARTDRQLVTAQYLLTLDFFPTKILLPLGRLQQIDQIQYTDAAGANQVLDSGEYWVTETKEPAEVWPVTEWPAVQSARPEVVKVTFTCGYGATQDLIPAGLREAIVEKVVLLFDEENGSADGFERLVGQFKLGDEFHVYG